MDLKRIFLSVLCFAVLLVSSQAERLADDVTVRFHHTVLDLTDSFADVTEMLVFDNHGNEPYTGDTSLGGIPLPLARGFYDLQTGWNDSLWRMDPSGEGIVCLSSLPPGMTRIVLNYRLPLSGERVEFRQRVAHMTEKYILIASEKNATISSEMLSEEQSIDMGANEVTGRTGYDLVPGTVIIAGVSPIRSRSRALFGTAVLALIALTLLVYVTARLTRAASVSEKRLGALKQRKTSLERSLSVIREAERSVPEQALIVELCKEKLAATERLIRVIEVIAEHGTDSRRNTEEIWGEACSA